MPDQTLTLSAEIDLQAAGAAGKSGKVSILAYSGGLLKLAGDHIVDLAGLDLGHNRIPILINHDNAVGSIAGRGTARIVEGRQLIVEGEITDATESGRMIRALAKEGHPFQASIGAMASGAETVRPGQSIKVNGRTFKAEGEPITVFRNSVLREVSIVPLGADAETRVAVAARAQQQQGNSMPDTTTTTDPNPVTAERERIKAIEATCGGDWGANTQRVAELKAKAIDGAITGEALNAELVSMLRESRPKAPAYNSGAGAPEASAILEASLAMSCGVSAKFLESEGASQAVLNEASSARHRGASLHTIVRAASRAGGSTTDAVNDTTIRAAFSTDRVMVQAAGGFSTLSVTDILSNTANKLLLQAYSGVASTWRKFCAVGSNRDFKEARQYRLVSDGTFAEVGAGGELKHASLSDQSFTTQLDTRGKILGITRKDLLNDDLGAFAAGPRMLGRDAAVALEERAYTIFLDHSSFFHTNNSNISTTTPLSIDGLTAVELLFLNQTDPAGRPTMIVPRILLVPNDLVVLAHQILKSTQVAEFVTDDDGSGITERTMVGTANPHSNRFEVVASPWLSNSSLTGYSTADWYLLADPAQGVAVATVSFLNGQQTPTIETADADFSTLGIQMRCYHDFGVSLADPRAGVKGDAA